MMSVGVFEVLAWLECMVGGVMGAGGPDMGPDRWCVERGS